MLQDLGDGLRMIGAGATMVAASSVGIAVGVISILVLTALISACIPAGFAWIGFQTLVDLRDNMGRWRPLKLDGLEVGSW